MGALRVVADWMLLAPQDPPVTVHARGFDWHKYLWPAVASAIVATILIAAWRALPKWLIVIVVLVLGAVVGLIKFGGVFGGHG